nr:hypothetical protein HmN_000708500 [Hymenolepis microstoma]
MWIAYVLYRLLTLVVVSGIPTPNTINYFDDTTVLTGLNLSTTIVKVISEIKVNVTDYLNGAVSASITNSTLKESDLITNSTTTVGYHLANDLSNTTDSNNTIYSNSTASDVEYSADPASNYTLESSEATSGWTEGNASTKSPEMLIILDENNPSGQPTLNETLTSQDLENKLNKAEKIGAIVGSLMAITILAVIIAIYYLYRKYRSEPSDY